MLYPKTDLFERSELSVLGYVNVNYKIIRTFYILKSKHESFGLMQIAITTA